MRELGFKIDLSAGCYLFTRRDSASAIITYTCTKLLYKETRHFKVVPQNSGTTFQNTFVYNRIKDSIIGLESTPKHISLG